jgi:hypothetical protein
VALESIAQFALVTNGHRLHYTTSWDVIYTGEFHPLLPNLTTSVSPLSLSPCSLPLQSLSVNLKNNHDSSLSSSDRSRNKFRGGDFLLLLLPLASLSLIPLPQICRRGWELHWISGGRGGLKPRPPHRWIRPYYRVGTTNPALHLDGSV